MNAYALIFSPLSAVINERTEVYEATDDREATDIGTELLKAIPREQRCGNWKIIRKDGQNIVANGLRTA